MERGNDILECKTMPSLMPTNYLKRKLVSLQEIQLFISFYEAGLIDQLFCFYINTTSGCYFKVSYKPQMT